MTSASSSPVATLADALETAPDLVQLAPLFHPERPILAYEAFVARVRKLLVAQMPGTALVICGGIGRLALDGRSVFSYEQGEDPADACDIDSSAWNDEVGAWDGDTHAQTWRYLERPEFDLTHATLAHGTHAERYGDPS